MLELPWGDRTLQVPLPDGWEVIANHRPKDIPPDPNCFDAIRPLAGRDLQGKRVLIVCEDISRPTPTAQFFAAVRDALLHARVGPNDIEILFALGVHRPMTQEEAEIKIGRENLAKHRWHNHDAFNPAALDQVGTTTRGTPVLLNRLLSKFDLIVTLGGIEPHLLLGFGGGYKMLLPGCAGAETIGRNHLQGIADGSFNYVGSTPEASPMRLDLEEGAAMLGKEVFIVNAVLNAEGKIVRLFCGDPIETFRAGAEFVRRHVEVEVSQQADVVITNSRPLDADLRQGPKCIGNTLHAARPGGIVLGFLRCDEGLGDLPLPSWTLPYPLLRFIVSIAQKQRIFMVQNLLKRNDPVEQKFLTHFGLQMLRRNHIWFFSQNLQAGVGKKLGALRQFTQVGDMLSAAARKLGRRATVAVFPWGGATYVRPR